jgi:MFS family permease/quinol monooxygenase YgiN
MLTPNAAPWARSKCDHGCTALGLGTVCDDAARMETLPAQPTAADPANEPAPSPLRNPVFRMLWGVWITANLCMWMNDVAAAWLMTTLTTSPLMVALVQTASTLPVFLLGLPSGALADIVDRRRIFLFTQVWVAAVGLVACALVFADAISPPLLIALTFANGIGLALRWPVFAALVPELVERRQLSQALALNAIAMNVSRIGGPVIAGALIAAAGSAYVFGLNALLSVGAAAVLLRWRHEAKPRALPGERFVGAIRIGVQHVRQSMPMRTAILRISLFFMQGAALPALLPLVARQMHGGSAATFTLLLACMGIGAIGAALWLPRLRVSMSRDRLVALCIAIHAVMMVLVSFAPNVYVAVPPMMVLGATWISVANTVTLSAQLSLPDWVRARGMSIYQMAMMGSSALGAALWGQVATLTEVHAAIVAAALVSLGCLAATRRRSLDGAASEDLTPTDQIRAPEAALDFAPDAGPVIVTVEYRVAPENVAAFHAVMQESRRSRLRQGVLSWELLRDAADPDVYVEHFIDETWADHLRRFDRMTAGDVGLRERRLALHAGDEAPVVTRRIAQPLD